MLKSVPHVAAMQPYPLADLASGPASSIVSLAQNESLRSPSPMAVKAAADVLGASHLYPDPDAQELKAALAEIHGVPAADILVGSGSLDLIAAIARSFAGPGRSVLAPAHAYPFFRTAAAMVGARFDIAPERGYTVDVSALLKEVKDDTTIVFLANPANPTGTRISLSDLQSLRAGLRDDVLLVVDEAYGEFADHLNERAFELAQSGNTVVLRSFSKAYGLAGLRVGWGVFPTHVGVEVRKVLNPNAVSVAAQAAACAAVLDQPYMRETCEMTQDLLRKCTAHLRDVGFKIMDSHTNFLLMDLGSEKRAARLDHQLKEHGLVLRRQTGAGLAHTLRLTIGPDHIMTRVHETFGKMLKAGEI